MVWTYDDKIMGKIVSIRSCEADIHGDNPGCLCALIGTAVQVGQRFESDPDFISTYRLVGLDKLVRRREVEILEQAIT